MNIEIPPIYEEDIIEFDYINETGWKFGLELQNNSVYIEKIIRNMSKEKLQRAFGGEYKKIQHYKLVIDDIGMYNIICKDIALKAVSS